MRLKLGGCTFLEPADSQSKPPTLQALPSAPAESSSPHPLAALADSALPPPRRGPNPAGRHRGRQGCAGGGSSRAAARAEAPVAAAGVEPGRCRGADALHCTGGCATSEPRTRVHDSAARPPRVPGRRAPGWPPVDRSRVSGRWSRDAAAWLAARRLARRTRMVARPPVRISPKLGLSFATLPHSSIPQRVSPNNSSPIPRGLVVAVRLLHHPRHILILYSPLSPIA